MPAKAACLPTSLLNLMAPSLRCGDPTSQLLQGVLCEALDLQRGGCFSQLQLTENLHAMALEQRSGDPLPLTFTPLNVPS